MKLATGNKINRLWNNGVLAKMVAKTKVLKTLEEVAASTNEENVMGASAGKELTNKLNGCSLEQDGNNFYIVGADAVRKKLGSGDFTITGTLRVSTDWRDNSGSAFKPGYLCNSTVTIVVRDGKVDSIAGNGGTGSMDSFPNNSHYVKTSFTINSIALD